MKRVLKWTLGIFGAVVLLFVGTAVLAGVWQGLTTGVQAPPAVVPAVAESTAVSTATAASVAQRAPDTAEPTFTIQPTYTPQATYTALPTYTPQPTYTPLPTDTPPRPTNTPRETNTPRPTNTPPPTATVAPTRTPTPRPLPTATTAPLPTNPPAPAALPVGGESAVVTKIIDGDTIEVSMNGSSYRVRYIGMDTPEIGSPCAAEATAANAALVSGRQVRMVRDVSETDRYDRLLRYVYVGDTFVNGALVSDGWAIAKDYPPDTAMSGVLHSLEAQAVARSCAVAAAPTAAPVIQPTAPPPPPPATGTGVLAIIGVDKRAEYVDIINNGGDVNLAGWVLRSEKGSQDCGLSGTIAAGQVLRIWAMASDAGQGGFNCGFGSNIWNNSEPDAALLIDPSGAVVSRW